MKLSELERLAWQDNMRPYKFGSSPPVNEKTWNDYHKTMMAHIEHLMKSYGEIKILWFDGGWERSAAYWKGQEVEALIRKFQPRIILNDRYIHNFRHTVFTVKHDDITRF